MATFGREGGEGTVIGTHVKLSGVLSDTNDIMILGKLDGEVNSNHTVTIGELAEVKGPITASRVVVSGTVRGNINSSERLEILPKGNVTGNIETKDLVVHSGSVFNGRSNMVGGEVKEAVREIEQEKQEPSPPQDVPAEPPKEPPEKERRMWPPIRLAFPGTKREKESLQKPKDSSDQEKEKPTYEVE